MINILFPEPDFRIKEEAGKHFIFDSIRNKWLLLTEEEWVRQNMVNYLVRTAQYPKTFIALEKEIHLNEVKKRFDMLIYDAAHIPWMLVECKAPEIALSEQVLQQALNYHIAVPVRYIVITNGKSTIGWEKEGVKLRLLQQLPTWDRPK
jgi:predicted type IV restriction endonuclease